MPKNFGKTTFFLVILLVTALHATGVWADDDIVPIDPNLPEMIEMLFEKLRDLLTGGSD